MLRSNQFIRVLAHLLVFAITFTQISTAAALIIDTDATVVTSHEQHSQSSSMDMTNCLHAKAQLKSSICCSSPDCAGKTCADKTCATGAHSVAPAVFISQARIPNRVCSKSRIEINNYLQAGISPASLYKPPR